MKNKPKNLYMIFMNMGGSLHNKIYTLKLWNNFLVYWDKSGNYDFPVNKVKGSQKYFIDDRDGCISFAFLEKADAELFLMGAKEFQKFALKMFLSR